MRLVCLTSALSAAFAGGAWAQAIGTMQVTARVLPAEPSWGAVAESRAASLAALGQPSSASSSHRTRLVLSRAEVERQGSRRTLIVTSHYPRN